MPAYTVATGMNVGCSKTNPAGERLESGDVVEGDELQKLMTKKTFTNLVKRGHLVPQDEPEPDPEPEPEPELMEAELPEEVE